MEIFNLPYDIFPGKDVRAEDIIIHDYSVRKGSMKDRSILHTNSISLVLQGYKTMHFAEKTVSANENEIHLLSAGNCLASIDFSKQSSFRSILIFFTGKALSDFNMKYSRQGRVKGQAVNPMPFVSLAKDDFIRNFITSLRLLIDSGQAISPEMKWLKFSELMLYLQEKFPADIQAFKATNKLGPGDVAIRTVMEANITNNLTIDELAFLCNLSVSTFKRRFAEVYGSSPNKWLLKQRMEIAARLLHHQHEKPGEVFHKVGYENHSSFSQSFKQIFGITPKEYQSQRLND
jgi:AraC-like DNA-binding protein